MTVTDAGVGTQEVPSSTARTDLPPPPPGAQPVVATTTTRARSTNANKRPPIPRGTAALAAAGTGGTLLAVVVVAAGPIAMIATAAGLVFVPVAVLARRAGAKRRGSGSRRAATRSPMLSTAASGGLPTGPFSSRSSRRSASPAVGNTSRPARSRSAATQSPGPSSSPRSASMPASGRRPAASAAPAKANSPAAARTAPAGPAAGRRPAAVPAGGRTPASSPAGGRPSKNHTASAPMLSKAASAPTRSRTASTPRPSTQPKSAAATAPRGRNMPSTPHSSSLSHTSPRATPKNAAPWSSTTGPKNANRPASVVSGAASGGLTRKNTSNSGSATPPWRGGVPSAHLSGGAWSPNTTGNAARRSASRANGSIYRFGSATGPAIRKPRARSAWLAAWKHAGAYGYQPTASSYAGRVAMGASAALIAWSTRLGINGTVWVSKKIRDSYWIEEKEARQHVGKHQADETPKHQAGKHRASRNTPPSPAYTPAPKTSGQTGTAKTTAGNNPTGAAQMPSANSLFPAVNSSVEVFAAMATWSPGSQSGAIWNLQAAIPGMGDSINCIANGWGRMVVNSAQDLGSGLRPEVLNNLNEVYNLLCAAANAAANLGPAFTRAYAVEEARKQTVGGQTTNV
jgi:hypothetical protein